MNHYLRELGTVDLSKSCSSPLIEGVSTLPWDLLLVGAACRKLVGSVGGHLVLLPLEDGKAGV